MPKGKRSTNSRLGVRSSRNNRPTLLLLKPNLFAEFQHTILAMHGGPPAD